jgi:hypothetical protein
VTLKLIYIPLKCIKQQTHYSWVVLFTIVYSLLNTLTLLWMKQQYTAVKWFYIVFIILNCVLCLSFVNQQLLSSLCNCLVCPSWAFDWKYRVCIVLYCIVFVYYVDTGYLLINLTKTYVVGCQSILKESKLNYCFHLPTILQVTSCRYQ